MSTNLAYLDGNGVVQEIATGSGTGSGGSPFVFLVGSCVGPAGTPTTPALTVQGSASGTPIPVSGTVAVTGTFWQTTQPVSAASLPLPTGAATATGVAAIVTALGSPLQAGGNVVVTSSALPAGAATAANQATLNSLLATIFGSPLPVTQSGSWAVSITGGVSVSGNVGADPIPPGATGSAKTQLEVCTTGSAASSPLAATLAGTSGKTTYLTGFDITGLGAISASAVTVAVTGLTNTLSYLYAAVAGVLAVNAPLSIRFNPPIAASAANTAIVVTLPALGTGNTAAAVAAYGFQQ